MSNKSTVKNAILTAKNAKTLSLPWGRPSGSGEGSGATPISSPVQVVNFGIDTLHLTYDADIPARILQEIIECKKLAQSDDFDISSFQIGKTDIFSWVVQRSGIQFYPYVLKTGDISLFLSSRKQGSSLANMSLHVGSISSQENICKTMESFKMWCRYHGISIAKEKVSRIDLSSDIAIEIAQTGIEEKSHHITRATKKSLYYTADDFTGVQVTDNNDIFSPKENKYYIGDDANEGVQIGRSSIVLRAYDKIREMKEKRQEAKEKFFTELWGGAQESVTRFEFQLRRDAIKEFMPRKSDFSTVIKMIPKMWQYLTCEWFRLAESVVDRKNKNQKRAKISELWTMVQNSCQTIKKNAVRNRRRAHISADMLIKQAVGCMLTVAASTGAAIQDRYQIVETATMEFMYQFQDLVFGQVGFDKKYIARQKLSRVSF